MSLQIYQLKDTGGSNWHYSKMLNFNLNLILLSKESLLLSYNYLNTHGLKAEPQENVQFMKAITEHLYFLEF